jgi:predicted DNA-binding WGR domain protein
MIRLTRSDPSRNMHRYYALQLEPTLFGEWSLVTEWGRIGAPGKVAHRVFDTEELASVALAKRIQAKTRRGYRPHRILYSVS